MGINIIRRIHFYIGVRWESNVYNDGAHRIAMDIINSHDYIDENSYSNPEI